MPPDPPIPTPPPPSRQTLTAARWVHLPSGRVYNDDFNPPKNEGVDDETGEALSKRPDDTPEVFSKRLRSYYQATAPLLEVSHPAAYFWSRQRMP